MELEKITTKILEEIKNDNWATEFDEGFLSMPLLWDNIRKSYESMELDGDTSLLYDFYARDVDVIKEVKDFIMKTLKREIFNSLKNGIKIVEEADKII